MMLADLVHQAATAALQYQAGDVKACTATLDALHAAISGAKTSVAAKAAAVAAANAEEDGAFDPRWSDDYVAPTLAEMLDAGMLVEPEAVVGLAPVGALLEEGAVPLTGDVALASAAADPATAVRKRREAARRDSRVALLEGLRKYVG